MADSPIVANMLGWLIAGLLALKVIATVVLLRRDRQRRYTGKSAAWLWWTTKITPLIAAPAAVAMALAVDKIGDAWAYGAVTLFAYVAVPVQVWRRHSGRLR